jgi:hypothetical protein
VRCVLPHVSRSDNAPFAIAHEVEPQMGRRSSVRGIDELPDEVMAMIREHVNAARREWEESPPGDDERRLLEAVFREVGEL